MTGPTILPTARAARRASREARPVKRLHDVLGAGFGLLAFRALARGLAAERDRPGDHPRSSARRRSGRRPRAPTSSPRSPSSTAPDVAEPGRVILLSALAYFGISLSPLGRPRGPAPGLDHAAPPGAPLADRALRRRDPVRPAHRLRPDERPRRGRRDARLPDSIDQRLDTCTDHLYGGLIGLVMGFCGAVASIWFVSVALVERSQPVAMLDRAGAAANRRSRAAARARRSPAAIDLVPGRLRHRDPRRRCSSRSTSRRSRSSPGGSAGSSRAGPSSGRSSDGAWRGELASMLNRVGLVAASLGPGRRSAPPTPGSTPASTTPGAGRTSGSRRC